MYLDRGAIFSGDRKYRYRLWRVLDTKNRKTLVFIMLNPSTADENKDDPTVRKCVGFAKKWGYSRVEIVNVNPFVTSSPKELMKSKDISGNPKDTIENFIGVNVKANCVVCAWGRYGNYFPRLIETVALHFPTLKALRINKDGSPAHPLYIPYTVKLVNFKTAGFKVSGSGTRNRE